MQARFLREHAVISGTAHSWQRTGDEGSVAEFHFCPICAATVFYFCLDQPERIAIPVGAFADPAFPPPKVSVYEERMHGWVGLPADIEHMA